MPVIRSSTQLRLLFILLLLSGFSLSAQHLQDDSVRFRDRKSSFGIRAGLNLANKSKESSSVENRSIIGFHIGVSWQKKLNQYFYISPSLLFAQQGFKNSSKTGNTTYTTVHHDYYINAPILINVNAGQHLSFGLGPQASFALSSKSKQTNNINTTKVKSEEALNPIDFSLVAGFTAKLTESLFFGFNYNLGLTNSTDTSSQKGNRNHVAQIGLQYYFNRKQ